MRQAARNATVYAFPEEAAVLEEESDGEVAIDAPLVSGDTFTLGGIVVEPFLVGGHTPGSAALRGL